MVTVVGDRSRSDGSVVVVEIVVEVIEVVVKVIVPLVVIIGGNSCINGSRL